MLWVSLLGFKLFKERSEGLSLTRVARNSDSPTRNGIAQAHIISKHSYDRCSVSTPVTRNSAFFVGPADTEYVIDHSEVVNFAVGKIQPNSDIHIVRILGNDPVAEPAE